MNDYQAIGIVDDSGHLRMPMADVNDFFRKHKGDRIVARFMAYPRGCSDALKGYYYNYVVPTMRRALNDMGEAKTDAETDVYLREVCPLLQCQRKIEDGWDSRTLEIEELGDRLMIDFLEWLKMWGAENMSVFIEEPKIL